jgi:hypothetical protein
LESFYNELNNQHQPTPIQITNENGDTISINILNYTVPIFGSIKEFPTRTVVFIRQCYTQLIDLFFKSLFQPEFAFGHPGIYPITGTPSIGKSYFAVELIRRLMNHSTPPPYIIYENQKLLQTHIWNTVNKKLLVYQFTGTAPILHSLNLPASIFTSQNIWIVDGFSSINLSKSIKTIIIASPNDKTMKVVGKRARYLISTMPVWSMEEINQCQDAIYSKFTVTIAGTGTAAAEEKQIFPHLLINQLMGIYGFIPRKIWKEGISGKESNPVALLAAARLRIEKRIIGFPFDTLIDLMGRLMHLPDEHGIHSIVHCGVVDSSFSEIKYSLASRFVADLMVREIARKASTRQFILSDTDHVGTKYGSLRGYLYESFVHTLLGSNTPCTFESRLLLSSAASAAEASANEEKFNYSAKELLEFDVLDSIEVQNALDSDYIKPRNINLGAIDSLCQPDLLFQITVAKSHPIKAKSLMNAVQQLRKYREASEADRQKAEFKINLSFIVPTDVYSSYTQEQKYVTMEGEDFKVNSAERNWLAAHINQYAVKVSLVDNQLAIWKSLPEYEGSGSPGSSKTSSPQKPPEPATAASLTGTSGRKRSSASTAEPAPQKSKTQ